MSPVTVIGGGSGGGLESGGDIDGDLHVAGNVTVDEEVSAATAAANQAQVGDAGVLFGVAQDVNLYRSIANVLKTDDQFHAALSLYGNAGVSTQVKVGAQGPSSQAGIRFGSADDTNLYRASADVLKTDDEFQSTAYISAFRGSASQISIGVYVSSPGVSFGSAGDTNLYRSAVGTLKTDHRIYTGDTVSVIDGSANRVRIGALGPASEAALVFGSAGDTNLYRSAADTLKTDDAFVSGGAFTAGSTINMTGSAAASFLEGRELTSDPAAPAADRGRLFMRDNGAGKTQLCVRFNTGAVQILATEP